MRTFVLYPLFHKHLFGYNEHGGVTMLRDRGTIKWNSLMLPEHVQILKEMWEEDRKESPPQLDEQALEELNEKCIEAYQEKNNITLICFKDGSFVQKQGIIIKLIPQEKALRLKEIEGTTKTIPIQSIVQLE